MEFIIIDGERVAIPPVIVSQGRDAVAAWVAREYGGTTSAPPAASSTIGRAAVRGEE